MNRNTILEKIAFKLQLGEAADDLFGKTHKWKGLAAVGVPSAYVYHSVAKANAKNKELSKSDAMKESVKTGIGTGALDGAALAALDHEKTNIKLPKRMALYAGGIGALDGGISALESWRQSRKLGKK